MTILNASVGINLQHVAETAGGPPIGVALSSYPCLPGQDVPYSFQSWRRRTGALALGTLTASLYLVDANGNQLPTALSTFALPQGTDLGHYDSGMMTFPLLQAPANTQAAVYAINGGYTLRLVITGTGKDGGPYTADAPFQVVPESIDGSWWVWSPDIPAHPVQWTVDTYVVAGAFSNRSQVKGTKMTCATVLEEVDVTRGPPHLPDAQYGGGSPASAPQGSVSPTVVFGGSGFTKKWPWYTDWIFLVNPTELMKTFQYQVTMTISDGFGNTYPPIPSSLAHVTVQVSSGKSGAANGAYAAFGVWAAASATEIAVGWSNPIAAAIFGGIASSAAAVLGGLGKIASDPPFPDPAYKTPVVPETLAIPAALTGDALYKDVASALALVHQIVAAVEALGVVESRILGAHVAGDAASEKMQRGQYSSLVANLVGYADAIQEATARAMPALDFTNAGTLAYLRETAPAGAATATAPGTTDAYAWLAPDVKAMIPQLQQGIISPALINDAPGSLDRLAAAVWGMALATVGNAPGVLGTQAPAAR